MAVVVMGTGICTSKVDLPATSDTDTGIANDGESSLLTICSMILEGCRHPPLALLRTLLHNDNFVPILPCARGVDNDHLLNADLFHLFSILLKLDGADSAGIKVRRGKNVALAIEREAAVNEGTALVVERLTIVYVQCAGGVTILVKDHDKSEGVVLHQARGTAGAIATRDNVATPHQKWNLLERRGHSVLTLAAVGGVVEVVVVWLVICKVHRDTLGTLLGHRLGKQTGGSDVKLIVDSKAGFIFGVDVEVGTHDRCTRSMSFVKGGVPSREKLVTEAKSLGDDLGVRRTWNVGLTAASVDVGMATEKRVVDTGLVPPSEQFLAGVTKEPSNVSTCKWETRDTLVQDHRQGCFKVGPVSLVIPSPHGCATLTSRVKGTSENKWAARFALLALSQRLISSIVEGHAVDIVDIAVLPVAVVQVVFRHRGLRAVEHRWLVHIVPDERVVSGALELVVLEEALPPVNGSRIEAVDPHRGSRPAPALILISVLVLDSEVLLFQFVNDGIVVGVFDVRINDSYKLPISLVQLLLHRNRVDKSQRIPSEVLLLMSVLNVKPDYVVGDVELIEAAVDVFDILIGDIVPTALMVGNGKRLRHGSVASELAVLAGEILRCGAKEDEDVQ